MAEQPSVAVLGSSGVDQLSGGGRSSAAIGKDPDQGRAERS